MAKASSSPSIIYSHQWICYRCHLIFQTNSIANLHTELSGHPTRISEDKFMIDNSWWFARHI